MVILASWLLADFITGIVHWYEDRYLTGNSKFIFINGIAEDNKLHHSQPWQLTEFSHWQNINTSAVIAWPICLVLFIAGAPTIVWLSVFFASFANLVHRYAHINQKKVPFLILQMQEIGLFISFEHHLKHHCDENGLITGAQTTIRYCPMSNWVNPVLDTIKFFVFLEYLLTLIGVKTNGKT